MGGDEEMKIFDFLKESGKMRMKRNPFTCLAGGRGGTFCMIMEWKKPTFFLNKNQFSWLALPQITRVSLILSVLLLPQSHKHKHL